MSRLDRTRRASGARGGYGLPIVEALAVGYGWPTAATGKVGRADISV